MSLPPMPQLTPAVFRWHTSQSDPHLVQRLANGTEARIGRKNANAEGQYDFYLNTSLRISSDASFCLAGLKENLAAALIHVRFQHPEVACTAIWGETGPPHIQYMPPRDNAEAGTWAHDTIDTRITSLRGLAVQKELEKQRREAAPKSAISLMIFLIADVADEIEPLAPETIVDVLMHFNHLYWDGICARMFVGDFLRRVGQGWGGDEQQPSEYEWGDEVANLSEPILDACKVNVEALGDEFHEARDELFASLIDSGSSWGLTMRNAVGRPSTEWYTFSQAESKAMIHAVKTRLGPKYTISHLGHAAMVLALLKAKPLAADTPDSTALVTPLTVNGRRFLRDEYVDKQYGVCQTTAVVKFENLRSWAVDECDREALNATLERGCILVKKSYDYWLSKEFNLVLDVTKDSFLSPSHSSSPMLFSEAAIPFFVSDGMVDRYVPGEVVTASGEKLATVSNCIFIMITYGPNILIRMESWKGATSLSFCYNDGCYDAEDAATFLKDIAGFMLKFAQ